MKPRILFSVAFFIASFLTGLGVWRFPLMGQIIGSILAGGLFILGFLILTEKE